jgi:uncharacterized protein involved in exopolysaccharide biosynthesis
MAYDIDGALAAGTPLRGARTLPIGQVHDARWASPLRLATRKYTMDCTQHDGSHRTCANGYSTHRARGIDVVPTTAALSVSEIIGLLRSHTRLWVIPAITGFALAAVYSLIAARDWQATQALIVRPEAASVSDERLGKFSDLSEMKTLQETIFELAKSQGVIEATLAKIGDANGEQPAGWPSPLNIEEFREQIDMRPPGGAEFGKTEVFYLSVNDPDRVRAAKALATLCDELETRLQKLREQRAEGMIAELKRAVALAEADLTTNSKQLSTFEANIGSDLAELRNLNNTVGGQGEVSQELQAIETERRANEALRRENVRLLALLKAAVDDPQQLLATPNSLLRSQPAVNRLKNALIDAQVRTASLLGSRQEKHPLVAGARAAEKSIRGQLHAEIGTAIEGLKVDLALNGDREESLLKKWLAARARIGRLAESRAEYANLLAAAENHTRLVEGARKNLADARARQAAAHSASVIARIDGVDTGVYPVGPSRKTIAAAGGTGGLILGFGLVFLFATPGNAPLPLPLGEGGSEEASVIGGTSSRSSEAGRWLPERQFGLFQGMSLEEAIRSVEGNRMRPAAR